jgi:hypothetical protein
VRNSGLKMSVCADRQELQPPKRLLANTCKPRTLTQQELQLLSGYDPIDCCWVGDQKEEDLRSSEPLSNNNIYAKLTTAIKGPEGDKALVASEKSMSTSLDVANQR